MWVSHVPTVEKEQQQPEKHHQQGSGRHGGGLWERHFKTFWFLLLKEHKRTSKGGWGRTMESNARLMMQNRKEIRRKGVTHSWFCCVNAVRQPRQMGSRKVLWTSLLLVIHLPFICQISWLSPRVLSPVLSSAFSQSPSGSGYLQSLSWIKALLLTVTGVKSHALSQLDQASCFWLVPSSLEFRLQSASRVNLLILPCL